MHRLFEIVVRDQRAVRHSSRVNLILTDDQTLRHLNREYRSKDRVTDVLSFNIDPIDQPDGVFGEIYISLGQARRQARGAGHGPFAEYLLLFCHGLLHLFGYDHANPAERDTMFELQSKYLNKEGGGR